MHAIILMTFTTQNNFAIYIYSETNINHFRISKCPKENDWPIYQHTFPFFREFSSRFRFPFVLCDLFVSECVFASYKKTATNSSHKFYDASTIWKLHLIHVCLALHIMLDPYRARCTMLTLGTSKLEVALSISHSTTEYKDGLQHRSGVWNLNEIQLFLLK